MLIQIDDETWQKLVDGEIEFSELEGLEMISSINLRRTKRYKKGNIPADLRWAVWERDNFTCKKCGSRRQLAIDHVMPESKGGETVRENLQTLCVKCNTRKGVSHGEQ